MTLEGKRNRRTTQRLDISVSVNTHAKDAPIDLSKGRGERLGDIERINHQIDRTKADDLRTLYKLCINTSVKVTKKTIIIQYIT